MTFTPPNGATNAFPGEIIASATWNAVFTDIYANLNTLLGRSTGGPPQGRLTLTSGTPIMTTDVAGATTVYYTPANGEFVPIYNGTSFISTDIVAELSQATTDSTKSPVAVANNSNYDVFVWKDGATIRATRGPAWTSDTARGTGAGTTELNFIGGIAINKVAITNGPAANLGTYVGTIRSNGTATIDVKFGTLAAGGGAAVFGVWNAYNRALARALVQDSTASWTYTSATPRSANNSATNRVSFVSGIAADAIQAIYAGALTLPSAVGGFFAIGHVIDVTNTFNHRYTATNPTAVANIFFSNGIFGAYPPQLGFHFIQAVEAGDGTNTTTLTGNLPTIGLEVLVWN